MKELENKVLNYIKKNQLLLPGDKPLIAVSGGIDSIVTLQAIYELMPFLKIKMPVVVHVNHKLRGNESERDQDFVKKVCEDLNLEFVTRAFNIRDLAKEEKSSIQETARKYRLKFIEDLAEKMSCDKIITGHNQDDLSETVLMWISRGSGLKGASGILPQRGKFVRPLLGVSRREISYYAEQKGLIYVEDSSNNSLDYVRNIVRKEVLPLIEHKCYRSVKKNLSRFAELAKNDLDYMEKIANEETHRIAGELIKGQETSVELIMLNELHPAIRSRVIMNIIKNLSGSLNNVSQLHIEKIMQICEINEGGKKRITIPGGYEAIKTYHKLFIRPALKVELETEKLDGEYVLNYPGTTKIEELGIRIDIDLLPGGKNVYKYNFEDPYIAFINLDKVNMPLKVRLPKQGDVFFPFGATGSKKLSDFFIDSKISVDERWTIPLFTDSNQIIWVIGRRISENFRINYDCKNVLMIKASWI